ncbi:MAG: nucleotidyl transferase AbiEii/AbiGii toxin family protein [Verrucomicrobiota bacterium]
MMSHQKLNSFYLVGGTALSLHFGHRKSIDLDLFTSEPFNAPELSEWLIVEFGFSELSIRTNTILGRIQGVKTDLITHQYPLIKEAEEVDGIRLLSVEDIAAMKLNAVANRGSKKDFWDLAALLEHFELSKLLNFFIQKYPSNSLWNLRKSLCYFDDAEDEPDPQTLNGQSWNEVKVKILRSCKMD